MPGDDDDLHHLRAALDSLLTIAAPELRERTLKTAIGLLIGDAAPPPPRVYNGPIPTRQPDRWAALRPQLRELIAGGHDRRVIAEAIGLSPRTLERVIGLGSTGPGIAVIERAESWLAARAEILLTPCDGAAPNGAAGSSPNLPPSRPQPAPPPPAIPVMPVLAARPKNGHDPAPGPPRRLTPEECAAIGFLAETDPASLRKTVSLDLARRAAAGELLAGEVVARLLAALG